MSWGWELSGAPQQHPVISFCDVLALWGGVASLLVPRVFGELVLRTDSMSKKRWDVG